MTFNTASLARCLSGDRVEPLGVTRGRTLLRKVLAMCKRNSIRTVVENIERLIEATRKAPRRCEVIAVTMLALTAAGCAAATLPAETASRAADSTNGSTHCVTVRRTTHGAVEDSRISERRPNKNFGSEKIIFAGMGGEQRRSVLMRFDVDVIPAGAAITRATVTLSQLDISGSRVAVYRITAPWDEGTVTWNSFDGAYDPSPEAIFQGATDGASLVSFDVTRLAREWAGGGRPNYGLLFAEGVSNLTFSSSEAEIAADRPQLEVCYVRAAASAPNEERITPRPLANYGAAAH